MEKGIIGQGFEMSNEGLKAIQGSFEVNGKIIPFIEAEGAEIEQTPEFKSIWDILDDEFHQEGRHLALTANHLNKEGIE
jgi:hypothetical protein